MKKIIYFDEQSATDMLNIKNGGFMISEIKNDNSNETKGDINLGVKTAALFKSLFFSAKATAEGQLNKSFLNTDYVSNTITNTILSDTLDYFDEAKDVAKMFEGYKIELVNNSIAYIQSVSPFLGMFDSSTPISLDNDLAVTLNKVDPTLRNSKGYYEVLAINGSSRKIFRFNNKAFRNNYGLTDLMYMDLVFYGVKVGKMKESKLDFNEFMDNEDTIITDMSQVKDNSKLDIYDIILAGVR